jgi:hypothetical protein
LNIGFEERKQVLLTSASGYRCGHYTQSFVRKQFQKSLQVFLSNTCVKVSMQLGTLVNHSNSQSN